MLGPAYRPSGMRDDEVVIKRVCREIDTPETLGCIYDQVVTGEEG
jgi:hypothetical protein